MIRYSRQDHTCMTCPEIQKICFNNFSSQSAWQSTLLYIPSNNCTTAWVSKGNKINTPNGYLYFHVYWSGIDNSQDMETKCLPNTHDKCVMCVYVTACRMEYNIAFRKGEVLSIATWGKLENILPNKISQTQNDKYCTISLTYWIYKSQTPEI